MRAVLFALGLSLCLTLLSSVPARADKPIAPNCTFKGVPLKGKVKIVAHHGDFKVRIVEHFEHLKVQAVEHFPDKCGRWQFVEHHPDFTIQLVEHFGDFTIRYVNHFPGLP